MQDHPDECLGLGIQIEAHLPDPGTKQVQPERLFVFGIPTKLELRQSVGHHMVKLRAIKDVVG